MSDISTIEDRKRRRKTKVEIAVASVAAIAALGIGVAPTFTDWASAIHAQGNVQADTEYLLWSDDGTNWINPTVDTGIMSFSFTGDESAGVSSGAVLRHLKPGDVATLTGYIKNAGAIDVALTSVDLAATGDLFSGDDPATVAFVADYTPTVSETIVAGDVIEVQITVTVPDDWSDDTYLGATGSIDLNVSASETA